METLNKLLVDTGCNATVSGQKWFDALLDTLTEEAKDKIEKHDSKKRFKFGVGESVPSLGFYRVPINIAGKNVFLELDVVNADIPCLLSKSALKKASAVLYLQQDKALIFGEEITLDITSSGHYAIPINKVVKSKRLQMENSEQNLIEEQVMISVLEQDEATKEKQLVHIHKQFCHPSINTMKQMLKESKILDESVNDILEKIYQKCEICLKFKRSKVRPSVGLPLSSDFN